MAVQQKGESCERGESLRVEKVESLRVKSESLSLREVRVMHRSNVGKNFTYTTTVRVKGQGAHIYVYVRPRVQSEEELLLD